MPVATEGCSLITYVATLDVPRHVAGFLARLLETRRRQIGTPRRFRALGPFRQAVLVPRWLRARGCVHCLARDAGVSQATGYRYPDNSPISADTRTTPGKHYAAAYARGLKQRHCL
ncbi:hypothetical protein JCM4814A_79870 [Streptomyces phaeofaciens JCM 4814]|uniref:Uncharacterized protein n=1 Tax=Streptomyces phaeofaciens TaxID=68254 RepID=A0A918HQ81_9ACTN|nr:hypothetical protein GCM10010226_82310 [Streptomyces phaeofaciens]